MSATTDRPQPTARESALLRAMVDHVDVRVSAVRDDAETRLAEATARLADLEATAVALRDDLTASEQARAALEAEVGSLRAALQVAQASAQRPVEDATALVRQARRSVDAAEDQIAAMRRWARDSLTARARALAA